MKTKKIVSITLVLMFLLSFGIVAAQAAGNTASNDFSFEFAGANYSTAQYKTNNSAVRVLCNAWGGTGGSVTVYVYSTSTPVGQFPTSGTNRTSTPQVFTGKNQEKYIVNTITTPTNSYILGTTSGSSSLYGIGGNWSTDSQ